MKLIELLVVIGILAILASISYPTFTKVYKQSKKTIIFIQIKHNQDITQAVSEDFTFTPLDLHRWPVR